MEMMLVPARAFLCPGLRVTALATVRKERRLPIAGQVLVKEGVVVRAEDFVARGTSRRRGHRQRGQPVGHHAGGTAALMLKQPGEAVK